MAIFTLDSFRDYRLIFHPHDNDKDDKSAYLSTGTLVGTASVGTGALVLDGDSDYETFPDAPHNSLFSVNQITIGAWFNITTLDGVVQAIITKMKSNNNQRAFDILVSGSDVFRVRLSTAGTAFDIDFGTTSTVISGVDTFGVMTWDGTRVRLYFNGIEEVSRFYSSGIFDSSQVVALGSNFGGGGAQLFFSGTIYQAFILATAMQSDEVEQLFRLGKDFRHNREKKQVLFHEDFSAGHVPNDWLVDSTGTFSIEFESATGRHYLACLAGTNVTLQIPTDDWSSSEFADTNTIIAGTPTVARNSNNVTITMSANGSITDVVIRRN